MCCRFSCSRYPFSCARTEGRSWVVSVLISLLEILELPLIPAKSNSDRDSFFGTLAILRKVSDALKNEIGSLQLCDWHGHIYHLAPPI